MIVILGGTFDPIHCGHLAIADQANTLLKPQTLFFMPCKQPVHKAQSGISNQHRINMLTLALENKPNYAIDQREIKRDTPSYAVESLTSFRQQYSNMPIFFIIGMDSLNTLHTWQQWQTCLEQANFLVFKRPGEAFTPHPDVQAYIRGDISQWQNTSAGAIYLAEHHQVAVSSSQIRASSKPSIQHFLPNPVYQYIKQHRLYP